MGPRDISDIISAKVGGGCFRLAPPLSPDPIEGRLTTDRASSLLPNAFSTVDFRSSRGRGLTPSGSNPPNTAFAGLEAKA